MTALWSERQNRSHNVSQKVKRIRRLSENKTRKVLKSSGTMRSQIRGKIRDENSKNSRTFRSGAFLILGTYVASGCHCLLSVKPTKMTVTNIPNHPTDFTRKTTR